MGVFWKPFNRRFRLTITPGETIRRRVPINLALCLGQINPPLGRPGHFGREIGLQDIARVVDERIRRDRPDELAVLRYRLAKLNIEE